MDEIGLLLGIKKGQRTVSVKDEITNRWVDMFMHTPLSGYNLLIDQVHAQIYKQYYCRNIMHNARIFVYLVISRSCKKIFSKSADINQTYPGYSSPDATGR